MCVAPGQIGGKADAGEIIQAKGWAFIHRYIIRRANELLRTGDSVSTVAYDLGFQTPSHFSRVYKKVTGIPPSAYK